MGSIFFCIKSLSFSFKATKFLTHRGKLFWIFPYLMFSLFHFLGNIYILLRTANWNEIGDS